MWMLFGLNSGKLVSLFFLACVNSALEAAMIILIKTIVDVFSNDDRNSIGYVGALMVLTDILRSLTSRILTFQLKLISFKMRFTLSSMVINKALTVNPSEKSQRISDGEVVNYVQTDSMRVETAVSNIPQILTLPINIIIYVTFLFLYFGKAFIHGAIIILIIIFCHSFFARKRLVYAREGKAATDARMKMATNVLDSIKAVKLYGWEDKFVKLIGEKRVEELKKFKPKFNLSMIMITLFWLAPTVIATSTILLYTQITDSFNKSAVIASISIFTLLRTPLRSIASFSTMLYDVMVSLERIQNFLLKEDSTTEITNEAVENAIIIKNGVFDWGIVEDNQVKYVLEDIDLEFKKGKLYGIAGMVGSGKTSLLNAILGNLNMNSSEVNVDGSISYAPQVPWILNATVKDNIVLENAFEEDRYNEVLELCQLVEDLNMLPGGDLTEIGEKGINLSGGQKARVNLARAVYAKKDIYIFDDILSALDADVGKKIFEGLILGKLKEKTVILVSHSSSYLSKTDCVFTLKAGKLSESEHISHEEPEISLEEPPKAKKESQFVQITQKEALNRGFTIEGKLGKFVEYFGGKCSFTFFIFTFLFWGLSSGISDTLLTKFASDHTNKVLLYTYIGLAYVATFFFWLRLFIAIGSNLQLSRELHRDAIKRVIRAPMNTYHDVTPRGIILNRLSADISTIDLLFFTFGDSLISVFSFLTTICICTYVSPWSLISVPFLALLTYKVFQNFLGVTREIKRLDSATRSPAVGTLLEVLNGSAVIRSRGCEAFFLKKFYKIQEDNFKIKIGSSAVFNFLTMILRFISSLYMAIIVGILYFFDNDASAAGVGLMVAYCLYLSERIKAFGNSIQGIQNSLIAFERVFELSLLDEELNYEGIEQECAEEGVCLKGEIEFDKFCVRYRENLDLVLKEIDLTIPEGQKVGICGRTGCGKSTLSLCLFRILEKSGGSLKIDGMEVKDIPLGYLRSHLTIIPQDPFLFQGSMRYNLDPLQEFDDMEITDILEEIGYEKFLAGEILNFQVENAGGNLSVGEKQIICIARALLRKSKIVILDEATASIDEKTEEVINRVLRNSFAECTVISIAHRIKTLLSCDRIIVLEAGQIVEDGSPDSLKDQVEGVFAGLYTKSIN